jgi:hypothetical protein
VIVFTEFRDSLDAVRRQLPFDRPASILHGGQDAIERRQQLKLFLDGQTSVLIATDVAGQGLNLQSRSRWVVSLELPWNPTKLEQRIGRVDRIGQRKPTRFTLLVARDESESGLLTNLSRRILTARRTIGADILSTVLPPEEAVRRALLFHAPLSSSDTGAITVPACHRWKRMARIAAESLARRRSLSARWRTALPPAAGAIRCNHPRAARFVPRSFESLWVFSVPVLDAADEFVERLVIGIGAREPASDSACCRAIAAALRHKVLAVARRRIRSWTIGRERAVKAALSRDHAIAAATGREFALHELQPGLFDQREIRTFDAEARDICGAQAEIERAIERAALAGNLRPGEPLLEMVLSRRR